MVNLGCATSNPSFVMSLVHRPGDCQIELWQRSGKYAIDVHVLPSTWTKRLPCRLKKIGAKLTELSDGEPAIWVWTSRPYKPTRYRY